MAISRGGGIPLDPLSVYLCVPDVSRLGPVHGPLSKARSQSKSTERLFGRGRQSANPRITGGLVSHDQSRGVPPGGPKRR
jgi:hypothetical protein